MDYFHYSWLDGFGYVEVKVVEIAYGVNYKGFFLELGLALPWEDELGNLADDPVIPCGYIGYLYRFRTD